MDRHLNNVQHNRPSMRCLLACAGLVLSMLSGAVYANKEIYQLPDPTRPQNIAPKYSSGQVRGKQATTPWTLESTLISENRRAAVINGRTYQIGESVRGAKIIAIEPYAIVLEKGSKQIRLRLLPRIAKSERR